MRSFAVLVVLGAFALVSTTAHAADDEVRVRFLGTSSLVIDDGITTLVVDGFVTRPSLASVLLGTLAPDRARVKAALVRAGATHAAAVITVHSHYDHALDAPTVAALTGALLVGTASTANLGRGAGLPEAQLRAVRDGDVMRLGAFTLTFIASAHSPHDRFPGTIDAPLVPPAPASAWKMGGALSLLVSHGARTLLVHGSAGFVPGALHGRRADVVYLGVGGLGGESNAYLAAYWAEVVRATGARRVVLVHWDDFFRPLALGGGGEPLALMPAVLDDAEGAIARVRALAAHDGVDVVVPLAWEPATPFR